MTDETPAPQQAAAPPGGPGMLRFAIAFLALFLAFQGLYALAKDTAAERLLIDELTVAPSAALIGWLSPELAPRAEGHRIVAEGTRLSVLNGCEGTESILLLLAAVLAYPASWRWKLVGALTGTLLVYLLNQGRVVGLFYALRHDRELFAMLHGVVAPLLIVLLGALFFLWWTSPTGRRP
jgi:exosortase family protein XrtM